MTQGRILILDFGSQTTQLIARRIREAGVYSEIMPWDAGDEAVRKFAPAGVVLSGGPLSVTGGRTPRVPQSVFDLGKPVLGICYGMQTIAHQLGGSVEFADKSEFGPAEVRVTARNDLLSGLSEEPLDVWMSHGDHVNGLPEGFECIAESDNAPLAAIADRSRRMFGVQFHPEVTHTRHGQQMIERFVHEICGLGSDWAPAAIAQSAIEEIRRTARQGNVLLALSGGVDSSVLSVLLQKAVGERLHCVLVDHGLLRLNEAEQVVDSLGRLGVCVTVVDARKRMFAALEGLSDPEDKRKAIGRCFIEVFEQKAAEIPGVEWLAQGTIYPDVIESAAAHTGKAHLIKSHHNVGGLPERMKLKLLEPLRLLFKDEVRRVGLDLGLPKALIGRHPFPGPGLAVRVLGEVQAEAVEKLRLADDIYISELRGAGWYDRVAQAFAVLIPSRSVAVKGDGRRYEPVIALRCVNTSDFMTASPSRLPMELLERVAGRICNEVSGISRVTYDISSKPPATIEWE